jgi:uncharacterized BrkB/YihY/UPF0761 family membrane protein
VVAGPELAERVADRFGLGPAFEWTWKTLQWPVVFALVSLAIAIVYYFAPDAEQDWIWITPGSILATTLWLLVSLAFRFYVVAFGSYNATYGTIGGVIVMMLWFYLSALAVLVGAELNAEIEHASPYGKDPGEKVPGEKKVIGARAERAWQEARQSGTFRPALTAANCIVDDDLPRAIAPAPALARTPRTSDLVVAALVLAETAWLTYSKLRSRFKRIPS